MHKYLCASLALLGVVVAGCGNSAPTKDEFIADVNKICQQSSTKLRRLQVERLKALRTAKDVRAVVRGLPEFVRDSRVIIEASTRQLAELELPKQDRDAFKAYIADTERSVRAFDDLEKAAEARDLAAFRRVSGEITRGNQKRDKTAKKLGLTRCGSS